MDTRKLRLVGLAVLTAFLCLDAGAQTSRLTSDLAKVASEATPAETSVAPSGDLTEAQEIERLQKLPAIQYPIQETTLAGAIVAIAESSQMNYIAPKGEDFTDQVAVTAKINPWKLLQNLSTKYRFTMRFEDGLWTFSRESAGALIAKTYQFHYANIDTQQSESTSSQFGGTSSTQGGQGGGQQGQGFGLVYKVDTKQIVDDVRQLIGLPPLASQTVIARDDKLPDSDGGRDVKITKAQDSGQRVIYRPDTNSLYVVAFRSQHEHIAEYIKLVDQPPFQIRIEARFFSTSVSPETIIGVNYDKLQPNITASNLTTKIDWNRVGATKLPANGVLSSTDLSLQLNALEKDTRAQQVQAPQVVTTNNREALFSVGTEEPFLDSSTLSPGAVDGGLGSTTNRISVKRIGTAVNVIPTYFSGGAGEKPRIRLTVKLELGRLVDFRQVTPQVRYPVVDSQKYEFTVTIEEGQALAFGGFTGLSSQTTKTGVAGISKVPLIGALFRHKNDSAEQRNLVAYIIPTIIRPGETTVLPEVKLSSAEKKK